MMKTTTLDKNKQLLESQDYYFLRQKGIEYIQNLSGKIWSDHNLHDPGITILESLCYALTDLGYRTGFPMVDLLSTKDGEAEKPETSGLFPAHEVLTGAPLTISDYRRLLLKIKDIRNAWLDPQADPAEKEAAIYADCAAGVLITEKDAGGREEIEEVTVRGLYNVLLELDVDDVLGSLNDSLLIYQVPKGTLKGVVLSLDSEDDRLQRFLDDEIDFSKDLKTIVNIKQPASRPGGIFKIGATLKLTDNTKVILEDLVIRVVNDQTTPLGDPINITLPKIKRALERKELDEFIRLFWEKQQRRWKAIHFAHCVLHAHRNLCEDFLEIGTISPERIAVCADIEVTGEADLEKVQAHVIHIIERYFNPPIKYYTLKELLEEGIAVEDIFNGPYIDSGFTCEGETAFTKPGFIKTEDLKNSKLREVLYVSDIINALMDLEGVVAVRNVMLRKIGPDGQPVDDGEKWSLKVAKNHQPVLYIERSKLLLFKNEIPYLALTGETHSTLDYLRAAEKRAAYVEPYQILELPRGRFRHPDRFYSIQEDLPKTYGVGATGLPKLADKDGKERVGRARQLKAYLAFYDQVLADYLCQLANTRTLFSLDENLKQTYFTKFIEEIKDVRDRKADEPYYKDFYLLPSILKEETQRTRLTEDDECYRDRRNRVLNHLMARFAERFTDYALMMYDLEKQRMRTDMELIKDKIDFLREYPVLGRERTKAFNYYPQDPEDVWNTGNVSGLEKRVSRLVGIGNYERRDLTCREVSSQMFKTVKAAGEVERYRIVIYDKKGKTIFQSKQTFSQAAAKNRINKLYPYVRQENTYQVDTRGGTGRIFFKMAAEGVSLRSEKEYETEADAVQAIRTIIDRYDEILRGEEHCNEEGFHLIEHVLLRPRRNEDRLMSVCLEPDGKSCGDEDPYSFRISVVLPYWPKRFQLPGFRRFFERTLREETPAHIHARICWVSNEDMEKFEEKYHNWLKAVAAKSKDGNVLTKALKELIEIMENLRTVYPAATLHDCKEDEDENPVRLGSTNLGIF